MAHLSIPGERQRPAVCREGPDDASDHIARRVAPDIMSLLALNVSLLVELFVLAFSLWLLCRSMVAATEVLCVGNAK